MEFQIGMSATLQHVVRPEDLATSWQNDVPVLATPILLWLGELACVRALGELPPPWMTVGSAHACQHSAPTPRGFTVEVSATLTAVEGRRLRFAVSARDGADVVMSGTHERFIIDGDKFKARVQNKADGAAGKIAAPSTTAATSADRRRGRYAVRVAGTGSYVPVRVITNEELAQRAATSHGWVAENLGIQERRICAPGEFTSDLAVQAAQRAITQACCGGETIDLLILATATPDRVAPSTACLVKHKLGIAAACPAFDVAAVCSGFMYALTLAAQCIASGAHQRVLVLGADSFSRITDWQRRDCVFFGDGAGALVLEKGNSDEALFVPRLYTDTRSTDGFTVYPGDAAFTMDPHAVYETAVRALPQAIAEVLDAAGVGVRDIAWMIPHQPSLRILKQVAATVGIPFDRVRTNMARFANTAAATIPLLLDEEHRAGTLRRGDLLLLAAVGAGWTWGAGVLRW